MNTWTKSKKENRIIKPVIIFLILFGVAFLTSSIINYNHTKNLVEHGETTTATILSIREDRKGEETNYYVLVEYEVNGTMYENDLGSYWSGMKEGQTIIIRYLPNDPNVVMHVGNEYTTFWTLMVFGIVPILIALLLIILDAFNRKSYLEDSTNTSSFIAYNSKLQVLFLVIPLFAVIPLFSLLYNAYLPKIQQVLIYILLAIVEGLFLITCAHFYFVLKVAIEIKKDTLIFYKRKRSYSFLVQDIKLIKMNMNWGSFDVSIRTQTNQKKSFHYLIRNSNIKKDEFLQYFEENSVKVITMDINSF